MTQVPEAITARLQEIEDNIARAREQQQRDATQADELKAAIADRRRGIRGWKLQRDALRYAVDAIEGRVIHLGDADLKPVVVERVAVEPFGGPEKPVAANPPRRSMDTIYEVMRQLGPAPAHKIAARAGFNDPRGIGSVLGRLRKEGRAARTEEGLWGPAHQ